MSRENNQKKRLLILNPGSTSTKIAVYEDEQEIFKENITHSVENLAAYEHVADQAEFRMNLIMDVLQEHGFSLSDFQAIVARGGILPPIKTGAYLVNEAMVDQLIHRPVLEHASNLGAIIGYQLAQKNCIPCFIYDGVSADEMKPVLKITGLPELKRKGQGHNLNLRAVAMRYAQEHGNTLEESNLIAAHMGGGISVALFEHGRIIDIINDEDGPFTPERAGALPMLQLVDLFMDPTVDHADLKKKIRSGGGFSAYFGTNDVREVEKLMKEDNEKAKEVFDAFAMNVAKCIGKEAPVVCGKLDDIILTGGIAYSEKVTQRITEMVSYLAPVIVYAGENELESLALGGLRVLRGQENYTEFVSE